MNHRLKWTDLGRVGICSCGGWRQSIGGPARYTAEDVRKLHKQHVRALPDEVQTEQTEERA